MQYLHLDMKKWNINYDILIKIQKYVQMRWDETDSCRRLTIQYDFS